MKKAIQNALNSFLDAILDAVAKFLCSCINSIFQLISAILVNTFDVQGTNSYGGSGLSEFAPSSMMTAHQRVEALDRRLGTAGEVLRAVGIKTAFSPLICDVPGC